MPAEKLLVFDVKEGWEPLCRFLNVPVPEGQEFPHVNDTEEFNNRNKSKMQSINTFLIWTTVPIAVAVGALTGYWLYNKYHSSSSSSSSSSINSSWVVVEKFYGNKNHFPICPLGPTKFESSHSKNTNSRLGEFLPMTKYSTKFNETPEQDGNYKSLESGTWFSANARKNCVLGVCNRSFFLFAIKDLSLLTFQTWLL